MAGIYVADGIIAKALQPPDLHLHNTYLTWNNQEHRGRICH